MGLKPSIFVFNGGKSRTILNWSPIAMAYYVYREDGIDKPQSHHSQGNLRIHNEFDAAKRDYDNRIDMIKQMGEIDDTVL